MLYFKRVFPFTSNNYVIMKYTMLSKLLKYRVIMAVIQYCKHAVLCLSRLSMLEEIPHRDNIELNLTCYAVKQK